jgi:hypothetical protein
MPDAYVIEVSGHAIGIVARESGQDGFKFFSSSRDFNVMEGGHFSDPTAAERAARHLAKHGNLPGRSQKVPALSGSKSPPV